MQDVGMLTILSTVLDKFKLSSTQLKLLHQHPVRSQQMIQNFGESFAWIGNIVVQVHERRNGLGYPRGLKGEKIHEVARILGLADAYEAMAHPRPDRKAQAMYNAVKEIIDQGNAQFDRRQQNPPHASNSRDYGRFPRTASVRAAGARPGGRAHDLYREPGYRRGSIKKYRRATC